MGVFTLTLGRCGEAVHPEDLRGIVDRSATAGFRPVRSVQKMLGQDLFYKPYRESKTSWPSTRIRFSGARGATSTLPYPPRAGSRVLEFGTN